MILSKKIDQKNHSRFVKIMNLVFDCLLVIEDNNDLEKNKFFSKTRYMDLLHFQFFRSFVHV